MIAVCCTPPRIGPFLCLLLGLTIAFDTPVRAGEAEFVEAGRSAGRAILILRNPWPCAIALISVRCRADITRFLAGRGDNDFTSIPNVGPHPVSGLQAFLDRGDRDGFDRSLSYYRRRLRTGFVVVQRRGGCNAFRYRYATNFGPGSARQSDAHSFRTRSGDRFAQASELPSSRRNPIGPYHLCECGGTSVSIVLAPLLESATQPFADSLRARPYDHARVLQTSMALAMGVQRAGSQERARQIAVGSASAQLTYNAVVIRNPDAAQTILRALNSVSELDVALPEFARLRETAAAIRSDDWAAQFSLGNALVAAIIGS